jgi:hypothetical protein
MALGKSAAFGGAPRDARTLSDSNDARGGGFASLATRREARRSQRQRVVSTSRSTVDGSAESDGRGSRSERVQAPRPCGPR